MTADKAFSHDIVTPGEVTDSYRATCPALGNIALSPQAVELAQPLPLPETFTDTGLQEYARMIVDQHSPLALVSRNEAISRLFDAKPQGSLRQGILDALEQHPATTAIHYEDRDMRRKDYVLFVVGDQGAAQHTELSGYISRTIRHYYEQMRQGMSPDGFTLDMLTKRTCAFIDRQPGAKLLQESRSAQSMYALVKNMLRVHPRLTIVPGKKRTYYTIVATKEDEVQQRPEFQPPSKLVMDPQSTGEALWPEHTMLAAEVLQNRQADIYPIDQLIEEALGSGKIDPARQEHFVECLFQHPFARPVAIEGNAKGACRIVEPETEDAKAYEALEAAAERTLQLLYERFGGGRIISDKAWRSVAKKGGTLPQDELDSDRFDRILTYSPELMFPSIESITLLPRPADTERWARPYAAQLERELASSTFGPKLARLFIDSIGPDMFLPLDSLRDLAFPCEVPNKQYRAFLQCARYLEGVYITEFKGRAYLQTAGGPEVAEDYTVAAESTSKVQRRHSQNIAEIAPRPDVAAQLAAAARKLGIIATD